MDEFLRYVVGKLVEHPDEVVISHRQDKGKTTYLLRVDCRDIGRLVGKGGVTITAIRKIISATAELRGGKADVTVLE